MGLSMNYDRQVQERIACALERIEQMLADALAERSEPAAPVVAAEIVKPRRGRPPKVING